jgi:hypothetical protein
MACPCPLLLKLPTASGSLGRPVLDLCGSNRSIFFFSWRGVQYSEQVGIIVRHITRWSPSLFELLQAS